MKKLTKKEMKNNLGLTKDEINLVWEFQETFTQFWDNDCGGFCVDGEILCKELGVKSNFNDWLLGYRKSNIGKLIKYGCVENKDYMIDFYLPNDRFTKQDIKNMTSQKRSAYGVKNIIKLTIPCAKMLCEKQNNNPKSHLLILLLNYIDKNNTKIIIKESPRLEYQFGGMLEKITGLEWKKQYPIDNNKYRLDFYIPRTLIVEYDEEQHEYQKEADINRIKYCREWLNSNGEFEYYSDTWRIPVIRVKKGEELEGIHRIIRHLAYLEFRFLDGYYYNINDNCDISCEVNAI